MGRGSAMPSPALTCTGRRAQCASFKPAAREMPGAFSDSSDLGQPAKTHKATNRLPMQNTKRPPGPTSSSHVPAMYQLGSWIYCEERIVMLCSTAGRHNNLSQAWETH